MLHILKKLLAISLIFLMIFQSFEKVSIFIYYQNYQNYIASYLCENRYKPSSNCNGQCYLMKKLRKAEERRSTPVVPDNRKSDFLVEYRTERSELIESTEINEIPTENILIEKEFQQGIFHPPKA